MQLSKVLLFTGMIGLISSAYGEKNKSAQFNFNGTVTAPTCSISVDSEVKLPSVEIQEALSVGIGQEFGFSTNFSITLDKCDNINKNQNGFMTVLSTEEIKDSRNRFIANQLTGEDAVKNVGIVLYYQGSSMISANAQDPVSNFPPFQLSTGKIVPFRASYIRTGESVTTGEFKSVITFKFNYR